MFKLATRIGSRYLLRMLSPKMIFFDLDDTLVGSTRIYDVALERSGVDPEDSLYIESRQQVKKLLGSSHVSSHHRLLYFKTYLEKNSTFSAKKLLHWIEAYEKHLAHEIKTEWQNLNRAELFAELSLKYRLGLITNETTRTQMLKLQEIDPEGKLFKIVVTSEEVGVQKPDPLIFQVAIERSGVKPAEILFVGDSVKNDLAPGTKMNFQVLGTREFLDESSEGQSFKWLDRLTDLRQLIS